MAENKKKKSIETIDKTKSWFFGKINKIDRFVARLTKKMRTKFWHRNSYVKALTPPQCDYLYLQCKVYLLHPYYQGDNKSQIRL